MPKGGPRLLVVLAVSVALVAMPAGAAGATSHHKKHRKPAAATGLTRAQVIALIRQYAPAAVAGAGATGATGTSGATGAAGQRGPTGPQGPQGVPGQTGPPGSPTAYSAGPGLALNGTQFSLDPASNLFQDPLGAPQCPAYQFLFEIAQAGGSMCDFGTVVYPVSPSFQSLSNSLSTVMSKTIPTAAPEVLLTGNVEIEQFNVSSVVDFVVCELFRGSTEFYGVSGVLPASVGTTQSAVDLPFTAVAFTVAQGTQFNVQCEIGTGTATADVSSNSTLAVIPYSG